MSTTNELPEKWYIKVTKENRESLEKWRTCGTFGSGTKGGYCVSEMHGNKGYYYSSGDRFPNEYIEINFDQFREHVLGEKIIPETYEIY